MSWVVGVDNSSDVVVVVVVNGANSVVNSIVTTRSIVCLLCL